MRAKPAPDPGVPLRDAYRALLVKRSERWATLYGMDGHHGRGIAALDAGETVIAVRAGDLRSLGVSTPDRHVYAYDLHPDDSITPSVIDRISQ